MKTMINNFGLGKYYDNYGYNVLEMPYEDYKANIDLVGAFLLANENYLRVITIDEFGNEIKTKEEAKGKNLTVVIYDINVWKENGLI